MTNYEEILRLKNPDRSSMLLQTQHSRQGTQTSPGSGAESDSGHFPPSRQLRPFEFIGGTARLLFKNIGKILLRSKSETV